MVEAMKEQLQALADEIDNAPTEDERCKRAEMALGSLLHSIAGNKEAVCGLLGGALLIVMKAEAMERGEPMAIPSFEILNTISIALDDCLAELSGVIQDPDMPDDAWDQIVVWFLAAYINRITLDEDGAREFVEEALAISAAHPGLGKDET
jgi:hypothetical protein